MGAALGAAVGPRMPLWFLLLLGPTSGLQTGQVERSGKMTDKELAEIEDLLNTVKDDGDMVDLKIPPPPVSVMEHRCLPPRHQAGPRR